MGDKGDVSVEILRDGGDVQVHLGGVDDMEELSRERERARALSLSFFSSLPFSFSLFLSLLHTHSLSRESNQISKMIMKFLLAASLWSERRRRPTNTGCVDCLNLNMIYCSVI